MTSFQLAQYLNKSTLVSVPSLFGDAEARPGRIVAAEAFGVWLISEALAARVLPPAERERDKSAAAQPIFVPFAQIGAIVPLQPAPSESAGLKPASAQSAASAAPQPPETAKGGATSGRTGSTARTKPSKTSGSAGA
jgi:hypothetical protein